jgi:uncharacterized protein (TIGR02300 family)
VCPKCGTSFDPEEALRSRRVRARSAQPDYEDDTEEPEVKKRPLDEDAEGYEDEAEETPEIDEAAEAETLEGEDADEDAAPGAPEPGEPDLGVDFEEDAPLEDEEADDVPFLEEEDEDFNEDEIEGIPGEERGDREER